MAPNRFPRTPDDIIQVVEESPLGTQQFGYVHRDDWDSIVASLEGLAIVFGVGSNPAQFSEFQQNTSVPGGIITDILSFTVPTGKSLIITGFMSWANVEAEYFLEVDGVQEGGGRSSAAKPTLTIDYARTGITAAAGQEVKIRALRTSPATTLTVNAQLLGILSDS